MTYSPVTLRDAMSLIFQTFPWYSGVVKPKHEKLLQSVLDAEGLSHLYSWSSVKRAARLMEKLGFENPLENSAWSNLIDGALKGLEIVALATFDWRLTAIVKLLQSWIQEKREEMATQKQQQEYGANYELTNPADTGYNQYSPPSYY